MRRSAGIYIVILAVLAGLYFYLNNRTQTTDAETPASTAAPVEYLFSVDDGLPTSIRVESKQGEVVEIARNAENGWTILQPIEAPADQGSVEAAAGQVTTIRVLDHVPNLTADIVGLNTPEYTISIRFTSNVERIIQIGVLTPTETGYYVSRGDGEILIVSNSTLDDLIGLLNNPPYLATETPLPPTLETDTSSGGASTPQP